MTTFLIVAATALIALLAAAILLYRELPEDKKAEWKNRLSLVTTAAFLPPASTMQSLTIDIDTTQLFEGANLMISALSAPFMFIAGLSLGAAILAAVMMAINNLRFR